MRTSNILSIGGAFVAILGGAFALLMMKAFLVDKGQGFVDLSGLIVGGVVCVFGLGLVAMGRKRARVEAENDERSFSEMAVALARKNGGAGGADPGWPARRGSRDQAPTLEWHAPRRRVFGVH